MIDRFLQDKWEEERSNRKESVRSINEAQYPSDTPELHDYRYRRCKKCKNKKRRCMKIEGKWLCITCRGKA